MTEMQAAIGLVQLEKLPGWLSRRRRNAALLDSLLADATMLRLAIPPEHVGHARYKYYAFLDPAQVPQRSEEHTSELQSLMRNSYAVFCLQKKKQKRTTKMPH